MALHDKNYTNMQFQVNTKGINILKTEYFKLKKIKANQLPQCAVYIISGMPCSPTQIERERERDRLVQYTSFPPLSSLPSNLAIFPLNFQNLHLLDPSTWNLAWAALLSLFLTRRRSQRNPCSCDIRKKLGFVFDLQTLPNRFYFVVIYCVNKGQ